MAAFGDADDRLGRIRHFRRPVVRDAVLAHDFAVAVAAIEQAGETLRGEELLAALVTNLLVRHGEPAPAHRDGPSAGVRRLHEARDYLAAHRHRDVGITELAAQVGLSRAHLTRAFTQHFGVPPHMWLNAARLSRARELLLAGDRLADVAAACGFADQSHFTRRFKGSLGLTPADWARQMRRAG